MAKQGDLIKTDLGLADKLSMDDFIRTLVAQMFENDNDEATLEVTLNGTDAPTPPKVKVKLTLESINDTPARSS